MSQAAPTILIVDDEAQNRRLLETLLRPEGYLTVTASNGAEALAAVAHSEPDLILLDIMMPGTDGYQVADILKSGPATSHIPIIMVTALVGRDARLAGLKAGAEEFLTKPVDRAELWLRVRNLLRLKSVGDLQALAKEEILYINVGLEERVQQRTAQLQAANDELEAFAYSVSHDLRSPLSRIDGFSGLLGEEIGAGAASKRSIHYLDRIRAGVQQMEGMIDGMLSLAQVSQASLQCESVDLSALAQGVADECNDRHPAPAVAFRIQPGMVAQGDPRLLRQVLDNLLGNACKFSGTQAMPRVAFTSEQRADGTVVYAVRDNGVGFDTDYADKLFCAFQRLHKTTEFPGSGIGLATVRRIVARHGGEVWADSAPGQGATFYFTLCAAPAA
ncbi:MAG: response regulator [Pseudomonadota bacterium]